MEPSIKYKTIMKRKWKNSKEQLDLMIKEKCINSSLVSYSAKNNIYTLRDKFFYFYNFIK